MSIDKNTVMKVARLARLKTTEAEAEVLSGQLSNILKMIAQLNEVNTDGIEPLAHPLEASQRLRADVVTERNNREAYQSIAPAVENGLYLVPKVID